LNDETASGIERAVFGALGREDTDGWLGRHLRSRLRASFTQGSTAGPDEPTSADVIAFLRDYEEVRSLPS
jgi:hypothetical protein